MSSLKAGVITDLPLESESSGDESAEQQLFAEIQASASKGERSRNDSAIRSAYLLNAARVDRRRTVAHDLPSTRISQSSRTIGIASSPTDMLRRKPGTGKLKRPSFFPEDSENQPRRELARRGDIFELQPDSPEKSTRTSTLKAADVSHNRQERAEQGQESAMNNGDQVGIAPEQSVQRADDEQPPDANIALLSAPLPSSENPRLSEGEPGRRRSGRLAGEVVDISDLDFARQPEKELRPKRKAKIQKSPIDRSAKLPKRSHTGEPAQATVNERTNTRRETRSQTKRAEPQVHIPTKSTSESKSSIKTKGKAKEAPEPRATMQGEGTSAPGHESEITRSEAVPQHELGVPDGRSTSTRTRSKAKADVTKSVASTSRPRRNRSVDEIKPHRDSGYGDIEIEDNEDASVQPSPPRPKDAVQIDRSEAGYTSDIQRNGSSHGQHDDPINQVFAFLDLPARSGQCETTEGITISRTCETARDLLLQPELSLQEVSETLGMIQDLLTTYFSDSGDKQLQALKSDAYAYLFRDLTGYLESLYDWFTEKDGDVSQSLPVMQVLTPFIQEIIGFKDMIASWKISLPRNYNKERVIMDVDTNLIVPLRKVYAMYSGFLSRLEKAERARRTYELLRQQRQAKLEDEKRKGVEDEIRKRRWERWQELHICRQLCEPDPIRRRRLFIDARLFAARFKGDERDANGIKFERVPLFKERVSPPAPRASPAAEDEWTDEQTLALIEGLTNFSGSDVFRKIFETYCRPGGPLRDFTVPEITAQASSIRSSLLESYQANDWEVTDWVKEIPVLP